MAIKKSDLCSSLWASYDQLRGGLDASQYRDFARFAYISDKYAGSVDCGSGSLLLKVADEPGKHIALERLENDVTTAASPG